MRNSNLRLMRKSILLVLFALSIATSLFAQSYSGKVVEQDGKTPICGVNVCLLSEKGLLVKWCVTDENGYFALSLNTEGSAEREDYKPAGKTVGESLDKPVGKLRFTFIGFKNIEMPLADFPVNGKIVMQSEAFNLEEVKVSAERIMQRADTLIYSVAGFSQPQDKSIADVIAKMPGMEVDANGQISVNGKSINKFYIEGMDLMSNRYALASKNIAKQRVKAVEVYQNHQPIELLRGKSFTEQAAINLILDDNSKMNLTGSADLGAGANKDDFLYSNRLMAMLFGKKHQNLSIYKNDNTGYDLFREINPLTLSELTKENIMEPNLISAVSIQTPDIDRSRYIFNKSHLAAFNHLAKLAEKTTLRTQISYFNDVSKQENEIETEYLFADTLAPVPEYNELREKKQRLDANLDFELNRPNLYLSNKLEGSAEWLSTNSNTVWSNQSRKLFSTPNRRFISNVLDVKIPLKNESFISVTSVNSYNELPQELSLFSGAVQYVDYTAFHTNTYANYKHRLFGVYANYQLGFKGLSQSLSSSVNGEIVIGRQHYKQQIPYGGIGLQYGNSNFRLEAEAKLHLLHLQIEDKNSTFLYPDGRFFFKYTLSGASSFSATYRYTEQLPDLRQNYNGYLFTSYRTALGNSYIDKAEGSHSLSVRYQYSQPIKGVFFSIFGLASRTQRHSAYQMSVLADGDVLVRSRQSAEYNAGRYMLNASFNKSFGVWKGLLMLNGSYIKSEEAQFSSGRLQDYDLDNITAKLSYSARPLRFLSFEAECGWQQTSMKSSAADSRANCLKNKLDLSFPVTNNLRLDFKNAFYHSVEMKENSWFSDFSASYTYKKMEFQLIANNLWGKTIYEREFVSSIESNFYRYTLRPREFIVKISFSF